MDQQVRIEAKGIVVGDPELKRTPKGRILTKLTIAASEVARDGQQLDPEQNKWQTAVFWGLEAVDVAEKVKKGTEVRLAGDLVPREFTDKEGNQRTVSEIRNGSFEVLNPPKERQPGTPVELTGVVERDPDLLMTQSGKVLTRVTVGVTDVQKGNDHLAAGTDRVTAVFWEKTAKEFAQNLKKGTQVSLAGELVKREYQDKDGTTRTANEIPKGTLEVLDRGKTNPQGKGEAGRAGRVREVDLSR